MTYKEKKIFYRYIYKITCTKGNFKDKFYLGQHTTSNLNDGYKGSGIKISNYYKKYPNDFIKEIISFHNTQDELNKAEYDIIHIYLNNPMCLNLCEGGSWGKISEESKRKISLALTGKKRPDLSISQKGKHLSEETKQKISEAHKGKPCPHAKLRKGMKMPKISEKLKGRTLSEETKQKISESCKGLTRNEETRKRISEARKGIKLHKEIIDKISLKNKVNMTGRVWLTNGKENYFVKPDEIDNYFKLGYYKGKTQKKWSKS